MNDADSIQQCLMFTFFRKLLVLERSRVSPEFRSFLARSLGLPLHILTVITLQPINSCPVALPSPNRFGRAEEVWSGPSPTSARSGIVVNAHISKCYPYRSFGRCYMFHYRRHFVLYHGVKFFIRAKSLISGWIRI